MAAQSEGGAKRAAQFGLHLLPQGSRAETIDVWRDTLHASGEDPTNLRIGIVRSFLVSDNPDRDWAMVKPCEVYRMRQYAKWAEESAENVAGFKDPNRIPQTWIIGSADRIYDELARFIEEYGFTDVVTWGSPPGLAPSRMHASLEMFARDVAPRLKARFA